MPECVVRSGWYEAVRSLTWRNVRRSSSRDSFRARFDPVVTILIVPRAHQAEIENPFLSQLERINSPLRQCESIRHYASANQFATTQVPIGANQFATTPVLNIS